MKEYITKLKFFMVLKHPVSFFNRAESEKIEKEISDHFYLRNLRLKFIQIQVKESICIFQFKWSGTFGNEAWGKEYYCFEITIEITGSCYNLFESDSCLKKLTINWKAGAFTISLVCEFNFLALSRFRTWLFFSKL